MLHAGTDLLGEYGLLAIELLDRFGSVVATDSSSACSLVRRVFSRVAGLSLANATVHRPCSGRAPNPAPMMSPCRWL